MPPPVGLAASKYLERVALGLWLVLATVVCLRAYTWPHRHSILPVYTTAAQNWLASNDMYALQPGLPDLYRYSPTAAILLVPLTLLPDNLASLLWRVLNLAVFFWGVAWWCRAVVPRGDAFSRRHWAAFGIMLLPLSLESFNNGQINPIIVGLTLAGVAAVAGERWNMAAACAALTALLKIYPLAVGLLLALVYPRKFGPRFLVALTLGLAVPFLCQRFDYVIEEYRTWLQLLGGDDRSDWPLRIAPQDLWLLFRMTQVPISTHGYLVLRLGLAAGVAAMCVVEHHAGSGKRGALTVLSTQACLWMILCGPNSEPCTYILLAPVLAWAVVDAWQSCRSWMARSFTAIVLSVLLLPFLCRAFSGGEDNAAGLMPLGAVLLWIYLTYVQMLALRGNLAALESQTAGIVSVQEKIAVTFESLPRLEPSNRLGKGILNEDIKRRTEHV
jgi:hypothetical protein